MMRFLIAFLMMAALSIAQMAIAQQAGPHMTDKSIAFIDEGGRSASSWASKTAKAEIITPGAPVDQRYRAIWWHCEANPLPTEMLSDTAVSALRNYVSNGGGLLLTGSAFGYVSALGVETAKPRYLPAGSDSIEAGFTPLPPCRAHPLFSGFSGASSMVTSGGISATSDLYGSGGPREGVALAHATPDEGEWPIVEYALGKGRILAIGWRLPDYGRLDNRYRANLDHLTHNALAYLSSHRWFDLSTISAWKNRPLTIGLVPNSHGTICGWLIPWSEERRKVIDVLRQHLACLRKEPSYRFALSEVPNIMSAQELLPPEEWQQLLDEIKRSRIELVNSFVLEPDVNIADGESLCQMAIQGVRWQQQVLGRKPSTCWMIDAVGMHPQMVQIVKKTGIDSIVFTRGNRTDSPLFRWKAPDGSSILAAHWPYYGWFGSGAQPGAMFDTHATMDTSAKALDATRDSVAESPVAFALIPIGEGDYSLPPTQTALPAEALAAWNAAHPAQRMEITTPSAYFRKVAADPAFVSRLPVYSGELDYSWLGFDVNMPFVKQRFRKIEHLLMTAEKAATIANLYGMEYPAQPLYRAWIDLLLNMDRNTIWGAAVEEVFTGSVEWNATDRFDDAERTAESVLEKSLRYLGARCRPNGGSDILVFNPLSWQGAGVQVVEINSADAPVLTDELGRAIPTQTVSVKGNKTRILVKLDVPAMGYKLVHVSRRAQKAQSAVPYYGPIDTPFYKLTLNTKTGAIASLRDNAGRELLAGESNVLAESTGADEHFPKPRTERHTVATSADIMPSAITVLRGPLATVIRIESLLNKISPVTREIRLYHDSPRIDFKTTIDWLGEGRIVSVHFQAPRFGPTVHGVPYGQAVRQDGTYPTVGWSDIPTKYGGLALLDRGIANREIAGNDAALLLLNSVPKYMGHPCPSIAANGTQQFEYAILPHKGNADYAHIPQAYWRYIEPLQAVSVNPNGKLPRSAGYLETGPNVLVTAMRREGDSQAARLVNLGNTAVSGASDSLHIRYQQRGVLETNMLGEAITASVQTASHIALRLRPQEIRTISIRAGAGKAVVRPITRFAEMTHKAARHSKQ